jgi:hypothetical protein
MGSTTILTLNVPYLAIDPNFPHHLNSFDNVPINYGKTLVFFLINFRQTLQQNPARQLFTQIRSTTHSRQQADLTQHLQTLWMGIKFSYTSLLFPFMHQERSYMEPTQST